MIPVMGAAFPVVAEERVDLNGLDTRPLHVAQTMLASVLTLIGEALGRPRNGAPREWTGLVRESLGRRDYVALLPVFGREQVLLPDCLTPLPRAGASSPADAVEEIASLEKTGRATFLEMRWCPSSAVAMGLPMRTRLTTDIRGSTLVISSTHLGQRPGVGRVKISSRLAPRWRRARVRSRE